MQFRDLKRQYLEMKEEINDAVLQVMNDANFVMGNQVTVLEQELAEYVGIKHCVSCANGTDALSLALMAWNIGQGDAVFVPDFTFFSTGEVVEFCGATPVFVDVNRETYNMSVESLEKKVLEVISEGQLIPRVIIPVDLFGQPADYPSIRKVAEKYQLKILEDGAQGFGGRIGNAKACSFGDIATTSFFPAKPLGCYGDGGAIFTNDDDIAELLRSYRIHGKGNGKYDNIRIGMNSRLDTIQAAVLQVKLKAFAEYELNAVNKVAEQYSDVLQKKVITPKVLSGFYSSWAQYTIQLKDLKQRDEIQTFLKENDIPSMVYYPKAMHHQKAFAHHAYKEADYVNTSYLCDTVLALPMHPYLSEKEIYRVSELILKKI